MNETTLNENAECEQAAVTSEAVAAETATQKKKLPKPVLIAGAAVLVIAIIIVIATIIANIPVPVEKIDMEEDSIQLKAGDMEMLEYDLYPSKASGVGAEWESSDEDVATVSGVGMVKAIATGKCTITVEIDGVEGEVEVFVLPDLKGIYSEYCDSYWAMVGSDGSYLEIDTNPSDTDDYSNDDAVAAIVYVTSELGLPDSLINSMSSTTALMGRQSETYEDLGIKVEWSYHPDNGLEVIYSVIE